MTQIGQQSVRPQRGDDPIGLAFSDPGFCAAALHAARQVRSTLDALTTAGAIDDDARVIEIIARKHYAHRWTGATITVGPCSATKDQLSPEQHHDDHGTQQCDDGTGDVLARSGKNEANDDEKEGNRIDQYFLPGQSRPHRLPFRFGGSDQPVAAV